MKTPRRTVTIGIILAIASCALIIALRSFAQTATSATFDVKITGWQKLKAPYNEDSDGYRKNVLDKHGTAFCLIHHRKSDGKESVHQHGGLPCPGSQTDASKSLLIQVANPTSSTPSPAGVISKMIMGASVTQQISCASATDLQAVVSTFDTSP
jgi:hypothetical protein